MSKNIYRCPQCKGTNVQHAMWVQLNSNQVLDESATTVPSIPFSRWSRTSPMA